MKSTEHPIDEHQAPSEPTVSASVGKILRLERTAQGKSLAEIAESTCININMLQAIEDGNREKLPADVFVRGFIRIYAERLQLDQQVVLQKFEEEWGPKMILAKPHDYLDDTIGINSIKLPHLFFLLVLLAAIAFVFFKSGTQNDIAPSLNDVFQDTPQIITTEVTRQPPKADPLIEAPVTDAQLEEDLEDSTPIASSGQMLKKPSSEQTSANAPPDLAKEKQAVTPIDQKKESLLKKKPAAPDNSDASTASIAPEAIIVTADPESAIPYILHAEFTERTWVRISIDGNPSTEYIFKANEQKTWKATDGFDIYIGNAGGVLINLNGNQIPINKESGQTVRLKIP